MAETMTPMPTPAVIVNSMPSRDLFKDGNNTSLSGNTLDVFGNLTSSDIHHAGDAYELREDGFRIGCYLQCLLCVQTSRPRPRQKSWCPLSKSHLNSHPGSSLDDITTNLGDESSRWVGETVGALLPPIESKVNDESMISRCLATSRLVI